MDSSHGPDKGLAPLAAPVPSLSAKFPSFGTVECEPLHRNVFAAPDFHLEPVPATEPSVAAEGVEVDVQDNASARSAGSVASPTVRMTVVTSSHLRACRRRSE